MARVICIFCKTETDGLLSAGYCDGCGRKLPTSAMLATKKSLTRSPVEGPAEENRPGGLSETLLLAAVVYLVCGGLFLVVGPALLPTVPVDFMPRVMIWTLIPTIVLGGLIFLSKRWPQTSVAAGLVLTVLWVAVTFALNAEFALRWLPIQVLLLVLLGYAMSVAVRLAR